MPHFPISPSRGVGHPDTNVGGGYGRTHDGPLNRTRTQAVGYPYDIEDVGEFEDDEESSVADADMAQRIDNKGWRSRSTDKHAVTAPRSRDIKTYADSSFMTTVVAEVMKRLYNEGYINLKMPYGTGDEGSRPFHPEPWPAGSSHGWANAPLWPEIDSYPDRDLYTWDDIQNYTDEDKQEDDQELHNKHFDECDECAVRQCLRAALIKQA